MDWLDYHKDFIAEWHECERTVITENDPYNPDTLASYLEWYNRATIPTFSAYVGLSSDGGPARERLHRPEVRFHKMVKNVIKFAKKAARMMRMAADTHFANEAFKMCREVVGTVDIMATFDRALGELVEEEEEEEDTSEEEEEETQAE